MIFCILNIGDNLLPLLMVKGFCGIVVYEKQPTVFVVKEEIIP